MPSRVAAALQRDGWVLRSDVVWVKPSALPESVSGTRWEKCRVKVAGSGPRGTGVRKIGSDERGGRNRDVGSFESTDALAEWADCPGCSRCEKTDGLVLRRGSGRPTKATERVLLFAKRAGYYFDQEAVREASARDWTVGGGSLLNKTGWASAAGRNDDSRLDGTNADGASRNLRDWWVIGPEPLKDAHYAAYPSALPERCIKAGTSEWGCCPGCGAPWARVVSEPEEYTKQRETLAQVRDDKGEDWVSGRGMRGFSNTSGVVRQSTTLGWRPTCRCQPQRPPVPARCLDPFGGSGTTALAANRLGRDCTLIELKPQYADLARKRVGREPLSLFATHGGEGGVSPLEEAAPEQTKQEQHPNRTVAGFNQRWKTKTRPVGVGEEAAGE